MNKQLTYMMMIDHHKIARTVFLFVFTAAFTVSCGSSASTVSKTAISTTAFQNLNGAHVRVLGLWSGPELASFMTVKADWEKETGGIVDGEGTQNLPDILTARLLAESLVESYAGVSKRPQ